MRTPLREISSTGDEIIVKAPKTKAGNRYVYFSGEMESLLREYEAFCAAETERYDKRKQTKDDYVFRRKGMKLPMTPSTFTWRFKKILKANDLPTDLNVHSLRHTAASLFIASGTDVETVVLLSHKKADSYIHIDVEFGEGEGKIPVDSIAKRAEAYKPKEKVTYKMIKEYIEAKYGFKVHTAYIAEVKRNLGLPMYDAPNAVEELKQPRKHPTPEKVEAIKDALRYFAVI